MTKRARLSACFALALVCALTAPATGEDDDANPGLFVGTTRGGDAQLHPALRQVLCLDCPHFPAAGVDEAAPNLATVGVSLAGRSGAFRGGVEVFTIVAATAGASGYAGLVTTAGFEARRVFLVGGFGLGSYYGGHHPDRLSAMAGVLRAELGVELAHGVALSVRADVLHNDISRSPTTSLGLGWSPR